MKTTKSTLTPTTSQPVQSTPNHRTQCHFTHDIFSCGNCSNFEELRVVHVHPCTSNKPRCSNMARTPEVDYLIRLCDKCLSRPVQTGTEGAEVKSLNVEQGKESHQSEGAKLETKNVPSSEIKPAKKSKQKSKQTKADNSGTKLDTHTKNASNSKKSRDIIMDKLTSELSDLTINHIPTPSLEKTSTQTKSPESSILKETKEAWNTAKKEEKKKAEQTRIKEELEKKTQIGEVPPSVCMIDIVSNQTAPITTSTDTKTKTNKLLIPSSTTSTSSWDSLSSQPDWELINVSPYEMTQDDTKPGMELSSYEMEREREWERKRLEGWLRIFKR